MLLIKNLKQKRSNKKLSNKIIDLFIIRNIVDKQAYRLALSSIYRIYNVFYISLLELYRRRDNNTMLIYTAAKLINDKEK